MGGSLTAEEINKRGPGGSMEWWEREQGQHRVRITRPFYLGKYEVTQEQWEKVMGSNPAAFKDSKRHPVEQVNWDDCQNFVKKLNETFKGKAEFRLPTEAEWEHACRAGTETSFWFGEKITTDQANYNGEYAWDGQKGVRRGKTVAVGSFQANPWGLYDVVGNVWEWCQDWYDKYGKEAQTDPKGPDKGSLRVLRGGSWHALPA
jgi:formylglycine-generating enzyme required for sulfatase activity